MRTISEMNKLRNNVVHKIPYRNYDALYVGQTSKLLKTLAEHHNHINRNTAQRSFLLRITDWLTTSLHGIMWKSWTRNISLKSDWWWWRWYSLRYKRTVWTEWHGKSANLALEGFVESLNSAIDIDVIPTQNKIYGSVQSLYKSHVVNDKHFWLFNLQLCSDFCGAQLGVLRRWIVEYSDIVRCFWVTAAR